MKKSKLTSKRIPQRPSSVANQRPNKCQQPIFLSKLAEDREISRIKQELRLRWMTNDLPMDLGTLKHERYNPIDKKFGKAWELLYDSIIEGNDQKNSPQISKIICEDKKRRFVCGDSQADVKLLQKATRHRNRKVADNKVIVGNINDVQFLECDEKERVRVDEYMVSGMKINKYRKMLLESMGIKVSNKDYQRPSNPLIEDANRAINMWNKKNNQGDKPIHIYKNPLKNINVETAKQYIMPNTVNRSKSPIKLTKNILKGLDKEEINDTINIVKENKINTPIAEMKFKLPAPLKTRKLERITNKMGNSTSRTSASPTVLRENAQNPIKIRKLFAKGMAAGNKIKSPSPIRSISPSVKNISTISNITTNTTNTKITSKIPPLKLQKRISKRSLSDPEIQEFTKEDHPWPDWLCQMKAEIGENLDQSSDKVDKRNVPEFKFLQEKNKSAEETPEGNIEKNKHKNISPRESQEFYVEGEKVWNEGMVALKDKLGNTKLGRNAMKHITLHQKADITLISANHGKCTKCPQYLNENSKHLNTLRNGKSIKKNRLLEKNKVLKKDKSSVHTGNSRQVYSTTSRSMEGMKTQRFECTKRLYDNYLLTNPKHSYDKSTRSYSQGRTYSTTRPNSVERISGINRLINTITDTEQQIKRIKESTWKKKEQLEAQIGKLMNIASKGEFKLEQEEIKQQKEEFNKNKSIFVYGKSVENGHFIDSDGKDMLKVIDWVKHANPKYAFMKGNVERALLKYTK